MADDPLLRKEIRAACGPRLRGTVLAGFTHRAPAEDEPENTFLFVPDRILDRAATVGWARLNEGYVEALHRLTDWSTGWLTVRAGTGPAAVEAAYREVLGNTGRPGRPMCWPCENGTVVRGVRPYDIQP